MQKVSKWFLSIVIGLSVFLVFVLVFYFIRLNQADITFTDVPRDKKSESALNKRDLSPETMPVALPQDLPWEFGAQITQNYTFTTPDGVTQSTRSYISDRSLAENYKLYSEYLKTNTWNINATIDNPSQKILSASKNGFIIKIDISETGQSGVKMVTVSLTEPANTTLSK